jgi:hypothetical protein
VFRLLHHRRLPLSFSGRHDCFINFLSSA